MQQDQQLTPHFWLSEFTHSREAEIHCIRNEPLGPQVDNLRRVARDLEAVRVWLGNVPIIISSGFRCPALNALVGGVADSAHLNGCAADFIAPAFGTPAEICQLIIDRGLPFDQLILEGTWVHLGIANSFSKPRGEVLTARFIPGANPQYMRGLP